MRAIVLTGADNFFCAGGNLNRLLENRAKDPSVQAASIDLLGEWISAITGIVEAGDRGGRRRGGRRGLFARARVRPDRRPPTTRKFVMSYARVGLTPDGGGSWFLTRALPRALASEILLEAKPIGAVRLHDVGVVNRLTRRGTALDSAHRAGPTISAACRRKRSRASSR